MQRWMQRFSGLCVSLFGEQDESVFVGRQMHLVTPNHRVTSIVQTSKQLQRAGMTPSIERCGQWVFCYCLSAPNTPVYTLVGDSGAETMQNMFVSPAASLLCSATRGHERQAANPEEKEENATSSVLPVPVGLTLAMLLNFRSVRAFLQQHQQASQCVAFPAMAELVIYPSGTRAPNVWCLLLRGPCSFCKAPRQSLII